MDINAILYDMSITHNVVWRISGLPDFQHILSSFLKAAKESGISVYYIHFSEHEFTDENLSSDSVRYIRLTYHFESFSTLVYNAISECEENAFFIFDSLSDLQTAWATDLMMLNFFRVITPMILKKNGKAFFPIIRSMHSAWASGEIMQDTEIFLDLYSDFNNLFLKPVKLDENDSSDSAWQFSDENACFIPLENKYLVSRFLHAVTSETQPLHNERRDSWERFFDSVRRRFQRGDNIDDECSRMSEIMMSRDPKIRKMVKDHFDPIDYFCVQEHMIGTGLIGGKACGMLISRKIIENKRPDIYERFEAHDSFYVGSDVFYSYIVDNDYWQLKVRQRTPEGYFSLADEFAQKLRSGSFSKKIEDEFVKVLNYYGNCPVIVRSSSLLEDGFGNAFAGKYESVFCAGTGTVLDRLKEFEDAIRIVYASTMSRSALDYRLRRALNTRDEQMSLLVMRVSGSYYKNYFMPCAAGVGYSYSAYRFLKELDPSAGALRLVMGLGTSAVDRTEGSYPRLVSLDRPEAVSFKTQAEHHRFSQRSIEVINTETSRLERISPDLLYPLLSYRERSMLFEHDTEAERIYRDRGRRRDITFVSCHGLVKDGSLMQSLRELLHTLASEYGQDVDIEFTLNPDRSGNFMINLLQCRPLKTFSTTEKQDIPENISDDDIVLETVHTSMGLSQAVRVDYIVYVDPVGYYNMPYNDKQKISAAISSINWEFRDSGKKMLLFSPGRLGTSSPELGVPTAFADISEFCAIFEIAETKVGYNPELSYGSHMFQDLVENNILYGAVFRDKTTKKYRPELFLKLENRLKKSSPDYSEIKDILFVADVSSLDCMLYHDMPNERLLCTISGR